MLSLLDFYEDRLMFPDSVLRDHNVKRRNGVNETLIRSRQLKLFHGEVKDHLVNRTTSRLF